MFAEAVSSLFSSPARRNAGSLENPGVSLADASLSDWLGAGRGRKSASGVVVTHDGALAIAAVYQAISLISGDASKLPLYPYERLPKDDRRIADKHRAYHAVAVQANPYKSAKRFWRDLMVHAPLWGNGFGYIYQGNNGIELYNLLPDRTAAEWVKVDDRTQPGGIRAELVYVTESNGRIVTLLPSQVLHIRGISLDGLNGVDLVEAARDAWGLALASQNFKSKFFKNGARIGGTLEIPAGMTTQAKANVEEGFRKTYEEGDNPFRTVILREGAKFHAGQVTPQQGQVSELSDGQKREVASFFNLPPSMLGIRDSVSYNSFEQERLAYLHGCLHHWTGDIADECDMKLLTEKERRGDTHYFEHNYSRFVQADWLSTVEGLKALREAEFINSNEGRKKLNLPLRTDPGGDEYINPNTRAADTQKPKEEPKPAKKKPATDAHRNLLLDAVNRAAKRLCHYAREQAKDCKKFEPWASNGAPRDCDEAAAIVRPAIMACNEVLGGDVEAMTAAVRTAWNAAIQDLSGFANPPHAAADLPKNVDSYLKDFERTTPERVTAHIMEICDVQARNDD